MLKESFIAPTPQEAYKLALQKYKSLDNFKVIEAAQILEDGKIKAKITIEVDEETFNSALNISEEEQLILEMNELKDKIARMKSALNPNEKSQNSLALQEVKAILTKRGLQKKWVDAMLDPFLKTQLAHDKDLLLSFVLEEIEEAIKIEKDPLSASIFLFVGPTGVGKTTTLAKFAHWAKKLKQTQNLSFINLDNFRVGAYEQLKAFATMLKANYFDPNSAQELQEILEKSQNNELIFIDTAGNSPYDVEKIFDKANIIKALKVQKEKFKLFLVVSANAKFDDLMQNYTSFSFLNLDSLIITKIDETTNIGNILAFLLEVELPVSFLTTGQNVPQDFELATKRKILDIFMGEIK